MHLAISAQHSLDCARVKRAVEDGRKGTCQEERGPYAELQPVCPLLTTSWLIVEESLGAHEGMEAPHC